jgi:hypothetical protein
MGFGTLKTTINDMPIYPLDQTNSNKFHLSWIGSDDIRVNVVAPSGLLLMENQILSFKIEDNDKFLVIRYHDAI